MFVKNPPPPLLGCHKAVGDPSGVTAKLGQVNKYQPLTCVCVSWLYYRDSRAANGRSLSRGGREPGAPTPTPHPMQGDLQGVRHASWCPTTKIRVSGTWDKDGKAGSEAFSSCRGRSSGYLCKKHVVIHKNCVWFGFWWCFLPHPALLVFYND